MAITTQVRSAASKINLELVFWCFVGLTMSFICAYGFDNLTMYTSALVAAVIIFVNMMREDAKYLTVDIRKIALLGIFLLIACKLPCGNFLLTAAVTYIFFRVVALISKIRSASHSELPQEIAGECGACMKPLPLLPHFGWALCLVALFLCNFHEPLFIGELRSSMSELCLLAFTSMWPMFILAIIWFFLEPLANP